LSKPGIHGKLARTEVRTISEATRNVYGAAAVNLSGVGNHPFVLREVEGFPTEEICKILDVTVTNFGVLIYRARARLRECLESKGWARP